LAAALECCIRELLLATGIDAITTEIIRLQDVFLNVLDRARFRPVLSPDAMRSPILSLIGRGDVTGARRAMLKQNVITTERGGYLRIAPHFYNTDDEMERSARMLNLLE